MWILLTAANAGAVAVDDRAVLAVLAAEAIQELRWWSARELRAEAPIVTPRDLPDLLDGSLAATSPARRRPGV